MSFEVGRTEATPRPHGDPHVLPPGTLPGEVTPLGPQDAGGLIPDKAPQDLNAVRPNVIAGAPDRVGSALPVLEFVDEPRRRSS